MANISVTYNFTNGTTADAAQVNQNFSDILNGTSDGTKDFSIAALTCSSTATFNGNAVFGNSASDTVTFTSSLASSIPIGTTRSYDIGSADLGLRIVYLAGNDAHTVALQAPSSGMSADYSLALPPTAPRIGYGIQGSSTSATVWAPMQTDINAVSSDDYTVTDTDGYGFIFVTTGNTTRTVTLPTAADNTDRELVIKKVDTGTGAVIVDGEGSETINGAVTYRLYANNESVTIKCDGTAWHIISYTKSDPVSFTPSTSWVSGITWATDSKWWKDGVFVEGIVYGSVTGGVTAANLTMTLPNSFTIDTGHLSTNSFYLAGRGSGGWGQWTGYDDSGDDVYTGSVNLSSTTVLALYYAVTASSGAINNTAPVTWDNNDTVSFRFRVPIVTT